jgi:hypothetical protein
LDVFGEGISSIFLDIRRQVYGTSDFNRDVWLESYRNHYKRVIYKFGDTDRLLVLDVSDTGAWSKLCGFLMLPIPTIPFPHVNSFGQFEPFPHESKD